MKYTVDTENKTIEIERATTKEVEKLCKKYKDYSIVSKSYEWHYPIYPYWQPYWDAHPYTIPCGTVTTGILTTGDTTDCTTNLNVPFTLTN